MKTRTRLIALVTAIFALLALTARPAAATDNAPEGYCRDNVGVLAEKTIDYITERNNNLDKNCAGTQICVLIQSTIGSRDITEYANGVFEKWNIGGSSGVLILLVTDDEDYTIVRGSALTNVLTPSELTNITHNYCEPYFGDGDYDTAVRETFRKLNEVICTHYGADPDGFAPVGTGRVTSCTGISCRNIGVFSFAACSACVGFEILESLGGED